jgi:hypothetical protein
MFTSQTMKPFILGGKHYSTLFCIGSWTQIYMLLWEALCIAVCFCKLGAQKNRVKLHKNKLFMKCFVRLHAHVKAVLKVHCCYWRQKGPFPALNVIGKVVPVLNWLSTTHWGHMDVMVHIFLTLALVGGEWLASRFGHFTPGEGASLPIG